MKISIYLCFLMNAGTKILSSCVREKIISKFRFADYVAVITERMENTDTFCYYGVKFQEFNMKINTQKREIMDTYSARNSPNKDRLLKEANLKQNNKNCSFFLPTK